MDRGKLGGSTATTKGPSVKSIWNALNELFRVLPSGARAFYFWYSVSTGMLAILDALALTLSVTAPLATGKGMTLPGIGELPESATPILVVVVCALFVLPY